MRNKYLMIHLGREVNFADEIKKEFFVSCFLSNVVILQLFKI